MSNLRGRLIPPCFPNQKWHDTELRSLLPGGKNLQLSMKTKKGDGDSGVEAKISKFSSEELEFEMVVRQPWIEGEYVRREELF